MSRQMIPFVDLKKQYRALEPQIQERINRVLEHGRFIMGPEVRELEERLAEYVGAEHCISVASGTEALLISLLALDISPGDEVITTPFTFVATIEVIVLLGITPVFVDIEPDTCNIDVSKIESKRKRSLASGMCLQCRSHYCHHIATRISSLLQLNEQGQAVISVQPETSGFPEGRCSR